MYQYLYAIADRLPAAWRPPDASVGGPVELRRLGDLVVLVSALEQPPEANARTLAVHHDVVASTLDASGTVPFRFGVVVDAADLDAWLAAHAPLVNTTLAQLRGCVEMSVKLLRLHCGHSIDRTCRECADGAPGVVQLRELAERLVNQAGVERWRYRSPGGGSNVAGSVAFLVARTEVDGFLARIAPIGDRVLAPGTNGYVRLHLTAPMALLPGEDGLRLFATYWHFLAVLWVYLLWLLFVY